MLDIFPFTRRIGGTGTKGRRICAVASVDETHDESEPGRRKKRTPSYRLCSHLLKEVRSRDLVEFVLVDDLHCDLLTGENMPGELHDGEMTAAKRLLQIVQAGDLAVVVAVPHPPMHLVSLKRGTTVNGRSDHTTVKLVPFGNVYRGAMDRLVVQIHCATSKVQTFI